MAPCSANVELDSRVVSLVLDPFEKQIQSLLLALEPQRATLERRGKKEAVHVSFVRPVVERMWKSIRELDSAVSPG